LCTFLVRSLEYELVDGAASHGELRFSIKEFYFFTTFVPFLKIFSPTTLQGSRRTNPLRILRKM
jgi:hypothetical protein